VSVFSGLKIAVFPYESEVVHEILLAFDSDMAWHHENFIVLTLLLIIATLKRVSVWPIPSARGLFCILLMYHGASLRGHYRHGFGAAGNRYKGL
jgi:hypothetical protein